MAYILNTNFEPQHKAKIRLLDDSSEYDQWKKDLYMRNENVRAMTSGIEVPKHLVPRRYQLLQKKEPTHGFFECIKAWAVDDRFVKAVEKQEPGVHQFHAITILAKDGQPLPTHYYLLNCCTAIDAIDADRSEVTKEGLMPDGSWSERWYYNPLGTLRGLCVQADRIMGRAMWFDYRLKKLFISDDVMTELKNSGVEGYQIRGF